MKTTELKVNRSPAARRLASVRIEWPNDPYTAWRRDKDALPGPSGRRIQ